MQGDPLSPFLFFYCFSERFEVGKNGVLLVQFDDVTIISSEVCSKELESMKIMLLILGHLQRVEVKGWKVHVATKGSQIGAGKFPLFASPRIS